MKKVAFMILLAAFSLNCRKVEKPDKVYLRSYVMYYCDFNEIRLTAFSEDSAMYPDNAVIVVRTVGKNDIGSYQSGESTSEKVAYDALCEKHGDMTFNRTILVQPWQEVSYIGVDFVSIEVTSDSDFDADHSAGVSLADILRVHLYSAKPYLDSSYTEYDESIDGLYRYSYIIKSLTEVLPDDLILLGTGRISWFSGEWSGSIGALIFDKNPTISKTHKFTVTMTADDGRVFTASVDMEFE